MEEEGSKETGQETGQAGEGQEEMEASVPNGKGKDEEEKKKSGGMWARIWGKGKQENIDKSEKKDKKEKKVKEKVTQEDDKESPALSPVVVRYLTIFSTSIVVLGMVTILLSVVLLVVGCNGLRDCSTRRYTVYGLQGPITVGEGIVGGSLYCLLGGVILARIASRRCAHKLVLATSSLLLLLSLALSMASSIQLGAVANDAPSTGGPRKRVDFPEQRSSLLTILGLQVWSHSMVWALALLTALAVLLNPAKVEEPGNPETGLEDKAKEGREGEGLPVSSRGP